jgi:hypothetical protein
MKSKLLHLAVVLALLGALTSCNYLRALTGHDKVAKVGNQVLYESDIRNLIPAGTSKEDSAKMVEQYINSWALSNLLLNQAEKELSKSEKDITEEVENFRKVLLGYRYENNYLESHLDTVITEDECRKYYDEHQSIYLLDAPLVKARVISVSTASPAYADIKKNYASSDPEEEEGLKELCASASADYTNFDDKFVTLSDLASKVQVTTDDCEAFYRKGQSFIVEGTAKNYLVHIYDRRDAGDASPYEYVESKIRETILSKRKQDLLSTLERDLLNDARNTHNFKIYKK